MVLLAPNYSLQQHSEAIHDDIAAHVNDVFHFEDYKGQIIYHGHGINDTLLSAIGSDPSIERVDRDGRVFAPESVPQDILDHFRAIDPK